MRLVWRASVGGFSKKKKKTWRAHDSALQQWRFATCAFRCAIAVLVLGPFLAFAPLVLALPFALHMRSDVHVACCATSLPFPLPLRFVTPHCPRSLLSGLGNG